MKSKESSYKLRGKVLSLPPRDKMIKMPIKAKCLREEKYE